MAAKASIQYEIDCTLPDGEIRRVSLPPSLSSSGHTVNETELSRNLYEQLRSEEINPLEYYFRYADGRKFKKCSWLNWFSMMTETQPKEVTLSNTKATLIEVRPYHVAYTASTKYTSHSKVCGCGHFKISSPNQVAFALARTNTIWICFFSFFILLFLVAFGLVVVSDLLPDNWISTAFVEVGMFGFIFASGWYLYMFLGRVWLVIDMPDMDNPQLDVMYLQSGWCMDHCWCRKTNRLDLSRFQGIRIEREVADQARIENENGVLIALVFDGDDAKSRRCYSCCGIRCCWTDLWLLQVSTMQNHWIVYYLLAKFFRDRYPERDELRFSIPKKVREKLKNYGVQDAILDEQGWKQKEFVDLQIGGNAGTNTGNNVLLSEENADDLEAQAQEIRDLARFLTDDANASNAVISRESGMVLSVLDAGVYANELVAYYKQLKDEYDAMYQERGQVFTVKVSYSKKILTLLAFKARDYQKQSGGDGSYTIKTQPGIVQANDAVAGELPTSMLDDPLLSK